MSDMRYTQQEFVEGCMMTLKATFTQASGTA